MNYDDALRFIDETYMFGEKIDLENVTRLCEYLGNPQDSLKFVHVAGTNGKGSTCTMISNILRCSGYRTGLYISPYLEDFCERIQINNQPISHDDLVEMTEMIKAVVERVVADGFSFPSQFEIITAMAFEYFKRQNIDIVVLEVGMGGRYDATNVIKNNEAAVICTIGYDHMQYLGDTLEQIAFEKAGIIKPGSDVSIYCGNEGDVLEVFKEKAASCDAKLHLVSPSYIEVLSYSIDGQRMRYSNPNSVLGLDEFDIALLGDHQAFNTLNVLNTCEILAKKGYKVTAGTIREALAHIVFAGRFEIMHRDPIVVIDGGHNAEGITSFTHNAQKYFNGNKVILFFGMLSDKEFEKSIDLLMGIAKEFYTLTPTDERGIDAHEMKAYIQEHYPSEKVVALDSFEDIGKYLDLTKKDEYYAFTGSLYMIGEARTFLRKYLAGN